MDVNFKQTRANFATDQESPKPAPLTNKQKLAVAQELAKEEGKTGSPSKASTIDFPSGKVSSDGSFVEVRILVKVALEKALSSFLTDSNELLGATTEKKVTLVLHDVGNVGLVSTYSSFLQELDLLIGEFQRLLSSANEYFGKKGANNFTAVAVGGLIASGASVISILSTASTIVSYFRETVDYKNQEVKIELLQVVSTLTNLLRVQNVNYALITPSLFPINLTGFDVRKSKLLQSLVDLRGLMDNAIKLKARINSEEDVLLLGIEQKIDLKEKKQLNDLLQGLKELDQRIDFLHGAGLELQTMMSRLDDVSKLSGKTAFLFAERLYERLSSPDVYTLLLQVESGGSNKVVDGLWSFGAKLTHSSGCILNAVIFDSQGSIVFGKSYTTYIPYKSSEEIQSQLN